MRNLILLVLFVLPFTIFNSCNDEEYSILEKNEYSLMFLTQNETEIQVKASFINGYLISDELIKVSAQNTETGQNISVYLLKSEFEDINYFKSGEIQSFEIYGGYGFDGGADGCLVYGTFFIGDNDVELFTPCGFNCNGFDPICPPPGQQFV